MNFLISSEILQAYSLCPRKAYLLAFSQEKSGAVHEYEQILKRRQQKNERDQTNLIKRHNANVALYNDSRLKEGHKFLLNATLRSGKLHANCPILTRNKQLIYEPTIVLGTYSVEKTDRVDLHFVCHLLKEIQGESPEVGYVINMEGKTNRFKVQDNNGLLSPLLEPLQEWLDDPSGKEPEINLNRHCPVCQFKEQCRERAVQEDNLTLLDRMTPKAVRQYEKKGIFTVKQLSYLFRPRKRKKRANGSPPVIHNLELQALAIRTGKVYLRELPVITRQVTELYLDIEGLPDRKNYYLIGLLVHQDTKSSYHCFWADTIQKEQAIWKDFVDFIAQYPDAPIYHYAQYESRAIRVLSNRYGSSDKPINDRMINVNKEIYGKVYFPSYSNQLKEIGNLIGTHWSSPDASGLQSLVWREYWNESYDEQYKSLLTTYNREDCQALKLLVDELIRFRDSSEELSNIDFADQFKNQNSETGKSIQKQLEVILHLAHKKYDKDKIKFDYNTTEGTVKERKKPRVTKKGYKGQRKRKPKASKIIRVNPEVVCPKHPNVELQATDLFYTSLIIDLIVKKNGIKKVTPKYIGEKRYCPLCRKYYNPPDLGKYSHFRLYGHGFKAWPVYHRVAIKIPYQSICEMVREQFGETMHAGTIVQFIKDFSEYYNETQHMIMSSLISSPVIHVDETRINIKGSNWYGWVFANDESVIFKLSETRESRLVHDILSGFQGVLISDFYAGYDSVNCKQQKCWVHLIRDLNKDLRESPFDNEYEVFVLEIKNLIVPIMADIHKYGLKKKYLSSHAQKAEKFFERVIDEKNYKSELCLKYQKRFTRYRESLFTFLELDDVCWHNNLAERAIRHLAIQRDNSTPWHEASTRSYLVLLSIEQTCRFRGKSFFEFLFSGEKDIYRF